MDDAQTRDGDELLDGDLLDAIALDAGLAEEWDEVEDDSPTDAGDRQTAGNFLAWHSSKFDSTKRNRLDTRVPYKRSDAKNFLAWSDSKFNSTKRNRLDTRVPYKRSDAKNFLAWSQKTFSNKKKGRLDARVPRVKL